MPGLSPGNPRARPRHKRRGRPAQDWPDLESEVAQYGVEEIPAGSVLLRIGRRPIRWLRTAALVGGLVQALDLGSLPQLGDELGLHLARQEALDLLLHLGEVRRL